MTTNIGLIDTKSQFLLSSKETAHINNEYFQVENFGFLKLTSNERYPKTWYPTPDVIVDSGWFTLDIHNSISGDFNNDGLMDLVLQPMLFPHVVQHKTPIYPIFLLQNASGGFENPATVIEYSNFPDKHFLYRLGMGDFNADGFSDIAFSSMGMWDHNTSQSVSQSPLVVFGGRYPELNWTDTFQNLPLSKGEPNWQLGYQYGHSLAVGDFNGDGISDWFSQWYASYGSSQSSFSSQLVIPNPLAAQGIAPWNSQWTWPLINAAASADFDEDGYDDLIVSNMPRMDMLNNGGDLWLLLGSSTGLQDGLKAKSIGRSNDIPGNVGTNFIVAKDFNGDGHVDLIYLEHYWTTDSGDTAHYYSKGKLKLLAGDGNGNFSDRSDLIIDPLSAHRHGEGNLHAMDVNGDGWIDLVLSGYGFIEGDVWGGRQTNETSIFLNNQGHLEYVDPEVFAYVSPYQFAGAEDVKPWANDTVTKLLPVDIGSDGMIDFVGFVSTPLRSWPQIEQQYLYAYVVKSLVPLGRSTVSELLIGTDSVDKIWGYGGNDHILGKKGDDVLDGGVGVDSAIYQGHYSDYSVMIGPVITRVEDRLNNRDGADALINIERLQFTDTNVALDIEGTAGQAYRIYEAVLGRAPDLEGLGYWINDMDNGVSLTTIASGFIASKEFKDKYGANPSYETYINLLYQNILDRAPDAEGLNYWVSNMQKGTDSPAAVLASFSEGFENTANVAPDIANGIYYTPWIS